MSNSLRNSVEVIHHRSGDASACACEDEGLLDASVYILAGDGCMMEGISSEAASLAGHLKLSNLCWLYDNNHITIEGHTELAFSEDVATRFMSYGWNVLRVGDANDLEMLEKANNLKSNDPYIIDSLGWALFKLKRYEEAKHHLQSAVKLMPSDPIVNDHYGDVLWKNGNKIQARYYWSYVLNLEDTEEDLKDNIKNKLILGL